jgi:serine/threonine protein phosphatase 1
MKRFVIGDIHGRYEALVEVLKKCKFDYKKDKLIIIGDIVDGGTETKKCVDELLKIKKIVFVRGNHDNWFLDFFTKGIMETIWTSQGGMATLASYIEKNKKRIFIPESHKKFFSKSVIYHIEDGMLFVHGGFDHKKGLKDTPENIMWDRTLVEYAAKGNIIKKYKLVFVGHTPTQSYGALHPLFFSNLVMMDCGAGWDGKLAIVDIDTKKFWLSKPQKSPVNR